MMPLASIFEEAIVQQLGWTLLHFIWQGVAAALLVGLVMMLLRRSSANARYVVGCLGLLIMAILPVVTFFVLPQSPAPEMAVVPVPSDSGAEFVDEQSAPVFSSPSQGMSYEPPTDIEPAVVSAPPVVAEVSDEPWHVRFAGICEPCLPWLVLAWLAGVLLLSLRMLVGWAKVQRLKRRYIQPVAERLQQSAVELAHQLRISRPVRPDRRAPKPTTATAD